ncbi:MAG: sulfatase-like hydrolase/transferase [Prevotellaceae bacterium]|jgi:phosphoglycerol transferase MdoB-like AlkP superfamily enzyme|nr:sulfatase-like hydrolase/transferase [Prevotellaceae bacterium]
MKERILGLVKIYVWFLLLFVLQKPLFMLFHHSLYADAGWIDRLQVMWHGLPLDLSLAAYLTVIPGCFAIFSVWTLSDTFRRICIGYYVVIAVLMSVIFVVNIGLYGYWGFPLDATPLFYVVSSPADALASITFGQILMGAGGMVAYAALLCLLFYGVFRTIWKRLRLLYDRIRATWVLLLLTALLFIPIRGGFSVATMNVGQVYFSNNLQLNHAAVNPIFSLMESLSKQKDFGKQYRFMSAERADEQMRQLVDPAVAAGDSATGALRDTLFTMQRPDVLIVILESFSSHLMASLGGMPDVAVRLDSLSREGVLFTHFYANSFRTDRGLVSILSGYPAQPTTSIMKYPRKTQNLPSIAGALRKVGYETHYYYGGDADFTHMRSYLMASGFGTIVSDKDFPVSERLSKWGVHDHLVFRRLLQELQEASAADSVPALRVLQTSSSHEPFEVPYRRLANDRLNAFAYTDSVVGDFIDRFRRLPQWERSVVLLVPDHLGGYPEHISNLTEERYRIPLIITGGAICQPRQIETYGSQQDIAATLLAQLGLPHGAFTFSKDLLDPASPHFAFFTVPDAFGMITPQNSLIYDCATGAVAVDEGSDRGANLLSGQAYLQRLYDDLAKR